MTERDRQSPLDTGYHLGAESPEEAAQFADVATSLGLAAEPIEPPASLKADLMAKLASTPQLAAADDAAPEVAPGALAPQLAAVPTPEPAQDAVPGPAEQRARSRWFTRPVAIAVAAVAAVALFIGGAAVRYGQHNPAQ